MLDYQDRYEKCNNQLLKKLFKIIIDKKTNLCVAANFKTIDECLKFVDKVGDHICVLKTQIERFSDGNPKENLKLLYEKKKKYNFLLFEDRKYHDGAETIGAIYENICVKYVDLVTIIASCCNDELFKTLDKIVKEANLPNDEPRGCLLVSELSFKDVEQPDPERALKIADKNSNFCIGIIAQKLQVKNPYSMIKATPGVHLSRSHDGSSQQWNHPSVVINNGADIVIVGRGIVSAPESQLETITKEYKEISYEAYKDRVENFHQ